VDDHLDWAGYSWKSQIIIVARTAPAYIPVEIIANLPLEHAWNDDDPYLSLGEPDQQVVEKLEMVSLKSVLAFALVSTEWILYRLKNHTDFDLPWQYVDAQWASLVIWKLSYLWDPGRENTEGRVRGPIDMAVRHITNCHRALKLAEGELDAALIARLAEFVLPDPKVFLSWQEQALDRLAKCYPRDEYGFGPATPREALDPGVEMTAESGIVLAEDYVRTLDFSSNEFLNAKALP
jgi:hypothetical protein